MNQDKDVKEDVKAKTTGDGVTSQAVVITGQEEIQLWAKFRVAREKTLDGKWCY